MKLPEAVADGYRRAAFLRKVHVSELLVAELRAARKDVEFGRGHLLPRATKPGRHRADQEGLGPSCQFKLTMTAEEYEQIRRALAAAGSSLTAVLRNPRHLSV